MTWMSYCWGRTPFPESTCSLLNQFWNQLFHTIFDPIFVNPSWDFNQIHLQQNYFSMLDLLFVSIWQTEILVEYKIM